MHLSSQDAACRTKEERPTACSPFAPAGDQTTSMPSDPFVDLDDLCDMLTSSWPMADDGAEVVTSPSEGSTAPPSDGDGVLPQATAPLLVTYIPPSELDRSTACPA